MLPDERASLSFDMVMTPTCLSGEVCSAPKEPASVTSSHRNARGIRNVVLEE